jgi:hypothetical protein
VGGVGRIQVVGTMTAGTFDSVRNGCNGRKIATGRVAERHQPRWERLCDELCLG